MLQHRKPRPGSHNSGHRLLSQEIDRVRKGVSRYSDRAKALAQDLEPSSEAQSYWQIEAMAAGILGILAKLEGNIGKGVQLDLQAK